jgi:hypothetical protein
MFPIVENHTNGSPGGPGEPSRRNYENWFENKNVISKFIKKRKKHQKSPNYR